jgi:phage/plasmid-associated DNA primase
VRPEASVKGGMLYAAYKKWCEENQMGRAMNGKDFGQEIKKRFPKKVTNIGRIYQGIGLLAPDTDTHQQGTLFSDEGMPSDGSDAYPSSPIDTDQSTLEADPQAIRGKNSDGSDAFFPKIINNKQFTPSMEGFHGKYHHSHHYTPP